MKNYNYLVFILLLLITGCQKGPNYCGHKITLSSPTTINEGETLTLNLENIEGAKNSTYLWKTPDMTKYTEFEAGRIAGHESFEITNFSIKDQGEYSVKLFPDVDHCEPILLKTFVTMIPKKCDCETPELENTLYYSPFYEGLFTEDASDIRVDSYIDDNIGIIVSGFNNLYISFGDDIFPENSSTYRIFGGQSFDYTLFEPHLGLHFWMNGSNHGWDYFIVNSDENNLFYSREGNRVTMQFCNVKVVRKHSRIESFKLSGKFTFDI